ncbi:hypothetical protein MHH70_12530 [Metasolibacillus sp. FSL H7-0170]|uniref:hypothetical protein n=1 Tax=Metasolibacillus sp. FSL H7-0170 TaxID=2921431 RepID=UPI003157F8F2
MSSIKEKVTKADAEQVGETIVEAAVNAGKVKNKPEKFMYVGPPTKTLPKYVVYEGGLPQHVQEHIKACSALGTLFIKPSELTNKQLLLADSSSVDSMLYKKAEEYLSEVK